MLSLVTIILSGCTLEQQKPKSFTETEEETKARYDKLLACKPNKPLSKGELYEKAMIQYWENNTNSAFNADAVAYESEMEKPKEYRNKLIGNEYQIKCNLTYHEDGTPDKVINDICYPYQVYQFKNLRDFYFGNYKESKNKNLADFIVNNKAQVYRWDKQPPIYKAENYNKDVDFMVRQNLYSLSIYPTDCCKLLSYNELLQKDTNHIYAHRWYKEILPLESLYNHNFLVIKTSYGILNPPYQEYYSVYPITQCGEIITFKFFN